MGLQSARHALELLERERVWAREALAVRVRVLDVRERFGRVDLLITPVCGSGERWVELESTVVVPRSLESEVFRLEVQRACSSCGRAAIRDGVCHSCGAGAESASSSNVCQLCWGIGSHANGDRCEVCAGSGVLESASSVEGVEG